MWKSQIAIKILIKPSCIDLCPTYSSNFSTIETGISDLNKLVVGVLKSHYKN